MLNLSQHCQCLVLGSLHYLTLAGTFVVDSAKMENAMDNHPVKLLVVCLTKLLGIGAHSVKTYHEVAADGVVLIVVERRCA